VLENNTTLLLGQVLDSQQQTEMN